MPPPAPSGIWNGVDPCGPLKAANGIFPQKPLSFRYRGESHLNASKRSATPRAAIHIGPRRCCPISLHEFRADAPARTCSSSAPGRLRVALARGKARFIWETHPPPAHSARVHGPACRWCQLCHCAGPVCRAEHSS